MKVIHSVVPTNNATLVNIEYVRNLDNMICCEIKSGKGTIEKPKYKMMSKQWLGFIILNVKQYST